MSQYMILIYEDEAGTRAPRPRSSEEVMKAHDQFSAGVESLGAKLRAGKPCSR